MNDRVGQQFGNYRLLQLLGQGGFAEVYLAEHIHIKTKVAIKILHGKITSQDVQAFTYEAQIIAALKHPHILRILDFGFAGGLPFLVMDYAPGGTLRDCHPSGSTLPLSTIISYVNQVADALSYAHDRKLIHRDIKPENMLLDADGSLLLSDFGIVTLVHSTASMPTIDSTGTVHYMAPEQIRGKPRPESDQYALAIIVYEWLCGHRPFSGESSIEIAMKQLSDPPPPLRSQLPLLPPFVDQVMFYALSKDPHQRFASVRAFATALEQAAQSHNAPSPSSAAPAQPAASPLLPASPSRLAQPTPTSLPASPSRPAQLTPASPSPSRPAAASLASAHPTSSPLPPVSTRETVTQSSQPGKQDYLLLCEQVGEKHKRNNTYGALVLPARNSQIGQNVYLLPETDWIKSSTNREQNAQVTSVKTYPINGHQLPAAIFTDLSESGYVVWIDPKRPIKTPAFPGQAMLVIDTSSIVPSPRSLARDMAYISLCELVGARHTGSNTHGALVVPPEYLQDDKPVYLLAESEWIKAPTNREANARAAFSKPYAIDSQILTAAIFTNLNENGYVIWADPKRPIIAPLFPGRATLVIDTSSVVPSSPSPARDRAYTTLSQQIGARHVQSNTYGALIIRTRNDQLWQPVYLVSESQWLQSPAERKKNALAAFTKIYHSEDQEVVAAVFTNLSEHSYIIWTNTTTQPTAASIQPGQAQLIDL